MSANWTSGYVGDVSYTLGFYRELAPTFLDFCAVVNGVAGPPLNRPLRYCELGCGRGYGTTLLAAANPDYEFVGIDFNPSHIAEARSLAARANISNVSNVISANGDDHVSPGRVRHAIDKGPRTDHDNRRSIGRIVLGRTCGEPYET